MASQLFTAIQNLGQSTVAGMTARQIEDAIKPVASNAGMISRELKALGWIAKPARSSSNSAVKVEKTAKPETTIKTLCFSEDFRLAINQLVNRGFIPSTGFIAVKDGNGERAGMDRSIAVKIEALISANPINADVAFITRHISNNDYLLAGIESPAMRQARVDAAKLASEKLEQAKQLVMASGFQLVKPESSALLAQFMANETVMLCEQSAIACQSMRSGLRQAWRNENRKARLVEARRNLANQEAQAAQLHTAQLVAEDLQAAADQRIREAMKAANDALIAKQASEQALQAMQAQMAAMQAQMQALMAAAQAKPAQAKPAAKLKAVA